MSDVADNAHDRHPRRRILYPRYSSADWALIREVFSNKAFIYKAHYRSVDPVAGRKITTLHQRYSHRAEIVAAHAANIHMGLVSRRKRGASLNEKAVSEVVAAQWKLADHRGLYARDGIQAVHQGLAKLYLFWDFFVAGFRKLNSHRQDVFRVEAGVDRVQHPEAFDQQAGRYDQDERKSDLGNHQQAAGPMGGEALGRASPCIF